MRRALSLLTLGLALSAVIATPAFAAKDPCKGVTVKTDAFGAARVFEGGDIDFTLIGTKAQMTIEFTGGGGVAGYGSSDNRAVIPAGTAVELKLADGSTVSLVTMMDGGSVAYNVMGILVTKFPLTVSVPPEQLAAILSSNIVAARLLKGADTWMSLDIKPSDATKWRSTVQCIATTGNVVPTPATPAPPAATPAPAPDAAAAPAPDATTVAPAPAAAPPAEPAPAPAQQ